jgi:glycine cleavage system H protein
VSEGVSVSEFVVIAGFPVDLDRAYEPESHLWVSPGPGGRLRVGLDALGVETSGTLAAVEFVADGVTVARGEAFGTLEAAKFVGPLILPISGRITGVNAAVLADPSLIEADPYREGWLVEVEAEDPHAELGRLLAGREAVASWWEAEVERYRLEGVLAQ